MEHVDVVLGAAQSKFLGFLEPFQGAWVVLFDPASAQVHNGKIVGGNRIAASGRCLNFVTAEA